MSETSSLTELARFVGQSSLAAPDPATRDRAAGAIALQLAPQLKKRGVTELLGAVLALSARTRRMLLPPVAIDLDVFAPNGQRALQLRLPNR